MLGSPTAARHLSVRRKSHSEWRRRTSARGPPPSRRSGTPRRSSAARRSRRRRGRGARPRCPGRRKRRTSDAFSFEIGSTPLCAPELPTIFVGTPRYAPRRVWLPFAMRLSAGICRLTARRTAFDPFCLPLAVVCLVRCFICGRPNWGRDLGMAYDQSACLKHLVHRSEVVFCLKLFLPRNQKRYTFVWRDCRRARRAPRRDKTGFLAPHQ
jgi:hypothetical protein